VSFGIVRSFGQKIAFESFLSSLLAEKTDVIAEITLTGKNFLPPLDLRWLLISNLWDF